MARRVKNDDREFLQWSREFSRKKIDMTVPRMRVQDYMQQDPERWVINATLNRLKSKEMQKYVKVEDETPDFLSLDDLDHGYHERIESEVGSSQDLFPIYDLTINSNNSIGFRTAASDSDEDSSVQLLLPTVSLAEHEESEPEEVYSKDDDTVLERERIFQQEIDKRVHEYLALENPDHLYFSSTTKVFSTSSVEDSEEARTEPVELRKIEEVQIQTQTDTLQEILLTPMPGPGFRMAQVAHPDDISEQGRRLPSVYFLRPRVRIFSAFPHSQQFWCRQGYPIPVPPPSKRNTFFDNQLLSANHPIVKSFPFRVRSYKANMSKFQADELIFVVEGRNIFVTGEKRKGNKVIRTVTEEICLPIDLDLNYIRVARSNKGEVIFEELWEYNNTTKGN